MLIGAGDESDLVLAERAAIMAREHIGSEGFGSVSDVRRSVAIEDRRGNVHSIRHGSQNATLVGPRWFRRARRHQVFARRLDDAAIFLALNQHSLRKNVLPDDLA